MEEDPAEDEAPPEEPTTDTSSQADHLHIVHMAGILSEEALEEWMDNNAFPRSDTTMKHPDCGSTPLVLAARRKMAGVCHRLLDANSKVNDVSNRGDTALHWACLWSRELPAMAGVVEALLLKQADCNVQGDLQNLPMHLAASANSDKAIKLLLMHGSVANTANKYGHTPTQLAISPSARQILTSFQAEGDLYREYLRSRADAEVDDGVRLDAERRAATAEQQQVDQAMLEVVRERRRAEDEQDDADDAESERRRKEEEERKLKSADEKLREEEEAKRALEELTKLNKKAKAKK